MLKRPTHLKYHKHAPYTHPPHKKHLYINLILIVIGTVATYFLSINPSFSAFILSLSSYKYIVAILSGVLFATTFTAMIGSLILIILHDVMPFWELIALAGLGAVIADLTILHVLNDELLEEIEDIINEFHGKTLVHIFHSRAFRWTLPVLAIIIIVTPIPNNLAMGLLGISRLNAHKFALHSYIINSLGLIGMIGLLLLVGH